MILVTGAGGTVGAELVKKLKSENVPFRAAYHSAVKLDAARASGLDAVEIDFARSESMRRGFAEAGTMFLLSGNHPDQTQRESAAVAAARQAGVATIVKLSVWDAETEAFSFAKIHRPVERAIEASGMAFTFLRPNGFMQNFIHEAANIKAQSAFYQSAGDAPISHIDVRDIAAVAAAVLLEAEIGGATHAGRAYTLSGPRALDCHEIARKLSAALGRGISYVDRSPAELRSGMLAGGVPAWYADNILELLAYYSAGHAARVTGDVRRITGRDPIPFEAFLADHIHSFR